MIDEFRTRKKEKNAKSNSKCFCERIEDGMKGSRAKERASEQMRERERERACARNGSKDRSTGESGRHEGFGDSRHAEVETSEQVLVISPWGKKELRFFRESGKKGRSELARARREGDANKPGRK